MNEGEEDAERQEEKEREEEEEKARRAKEDLNSLSDLDELLFCRSVNQVKVLTPQKSHFKSSVAEFCQFSVSLSLMRSTLH